MTPSERHARPSLGASYAATRRRTSVWQSLKADALRWQSHPEDAEVLARLNDGLSELRRVESYWAYPGKHVVERLAGLVADEDPEALATLTSLVVRMLVSGAYRVFSEDTEDQGLSPESAQGLVPDLVLDERPYFEVLVVDDLPPREEDRLRERMIALRSEGDPFVYDLVIVPSFEDALIAALLNPQLQSVVIRYGFRLASRHSLGLAERALARFDQGELDAVEIGPALGQAIARLRPNLDLFLVSDAAVEDIALQHRRTFRRIFFRQEDLLELHLSITKGVQARYCTPFFSALKSYSQRPTGVFHALPIARGKSVSRSYWIRDLEELFGESLLLAETSATTGGLDSLLQPHGSLREAQALAARAFGTRQTFFVTNGTSTANKIVLQAIARPGDIVLAARDCHMSHHYAFVLSGVEPLYMDPYPIQRFGFYGGVPLAVIKRHLLELKARGQLDRARVLLLTNCTFDGIVYNPLRVMEEVLAIQPDMTFVWDEAWFAFARFTPITRRRTAMQAAADLRERLASPDYRARHAEWRARFDADPEPERWYGPLLADPDRAKVRVYATHSTHKTLTSLRQGSMIHVSDDLFESDVEQSFHQAYLTHTSSSANYPILASLDIGRRQVELEGYEMVQHAIELALILRQQVNSNPGLKRHFDLLTPEDLIPSEHRTSAFSAYALAGTDWEAMDRAWEDDEFCLDPTRLTLAVGRTGMTGDAFKSLLIDQHDIQVNKTSLNTVLFMTHIGTTRGALAHLISSLANIADELDDHAAVQGAPRAALRSAAARRLTGELLPLPDFSAFHPRFCGGSGAPGREGDIRAAFFAANLSENVRHLRLDGTIEAELDAGRVVVSAGFVTPYPPGFPVLVTGQVVSREILAFLKSIDIEIHGYDPEVGLRVFTPEALGQ
ncbi:MAG: ornithine decarboxylase [Planctomycetes bacterium]|nr:ornithine decarboxylase [Planctomycetota bacterium]